VTANPEQPIPPLESGQWFGEAWTLAHIRAARLRSVIELFEGIVDDPALTWPPRGGSSLSG
jgi:hypothetical protein